MIFLEIIEVVVATLIIYLGVTQVVIPWGKGTPFFPMFKRSQMLKERIKEANQKLEEAGLRNEAEKIEKKAKEK